MSVKQEKPRGELTIRTLAMPADTNPAGDIFGGWVLSQMDIAGAVLARKESNKRVVTIAVNSMEFHKPVFVGDVLCCYVGVLKKGTTSITIGIEAWASRANNTENIKVTQGTFTYVCVDDNRNPIPID